MSGKRGLTQGEIAMLREAFAEKVDYMPIRLSDGAGANLLARAAFRQKRNWAMTYLNTIHYNDGRFSADFSQDPDPRHRALLFHEMTHVWQYKTLGLVSFAIRYGANFVSCNFDPMRTYDYSKAERFGEATLEGQAQMVGDYYLERNKASAREAALREKLKDTGFYGL